MSPIRGLPPVTLYEVKPVHRWSAKETPASWITFWGGHGYDGCCMLTQVIVTGRERSFRWHEI